MPNHLGVPLKTAYPAPVPASVRDHIRTHTHDHPDAYRSDISRWHTLRTTTTTTTTTHDNAVDPFLRYHAQLVCILAKLPSDINLDISYAHAFAPPTAIPVTLPSLAFERAALVFNLAALYSQLANAQDRSTHDGLKAATAHYQNAAGTFAFLVSSVLPKLSLPPDIEDPPTDLTQPFVSSLQFLMLAQAQECAWQRAVSDHYKNALIAKLAAGIASLYASSLGAIRSAPSEIRASLPSHWLIHLETKKRHFHAAAHYRKSMDDLETNRYGDELRRLMDAEAEAKQAYNAAKRSSVAVAVVQDIKSLLDVLQKNLLRAQRDNDLIYHQNIPPSTAIDPIQEVVMVKTIVPPGLLDPKSVIGNDAILFADMLTWGVREAVNIYDDNKRALVQERLVDPARELDDETDRTLRSLNLPASLEALERPIGLPPSLLKKAEEIRLEQGIERIDVYLGDAERLARRCTALLDEAMDILDSEASEDEATRKHIPVSRPPSHEANRELIVKQKQYRDLLVEAAKSDAIVRQKWEDSEASISNLALDEEQLEAIVPSSTVSIDGNRPLGSDQTWIHARTLRGLLETINQVKNDRAQVVSRAQRLVEVDDIKSRVITAANRYESWDEVTPAMFVDLSDGELAKYDRFIQCLSESQKKQDGLLEAVKSANREFLLSRKEDPIVKERETVLQNLDMAYARYHEITRNLDEGSKFYNDMTGILTRFKEACKGWSHQRSQEAQSLYRSFSSLSIRGEEGSDPKSVVEPRSPTVAELGVTKERANLSALSSTEWESQELPPPPALSNTPVPNSKADELALRTPGKRGTVVRAQQHLPHDDPWTGRSPQVGKVRGLERERGHGRGRGHGHGRGSGRGGPGKIADLPSLSSAEWETMEGPIPMGDSRLLTGRVGKEGGARE